MAHADEDRRPKYMRIADFLREAIGAGKYGPGDRLPGESELVAKFGVASMTVRHAMSVLKSEGLVEPRRGAGVFVRDTRHAKHPPRTVTPLHSVSVSGVVVRPDGRVLTIRRADNGTWEPPGGVLEPMEAIEDGVRREVLEETGIKVHVERLTGVYKNTSLGVVALVFRCRPEGGRVRLSDESTAVAWLTPHEAVASMSEVYAIRVTDAFRNEAPCIRTHDGRQLTLRPDA
ncbi:NUDIX domain-containing protein [Streptomyces sp900105245]|uniref:NUDIX domain-containing protein n=1 Tax=Streptomyces sp. 900105245 TaxID=3154379 RepID=UPI00332C474A